MTTIANALFGRLARHRQREMLLDLDDYLLNDIGISRADLRPPSLRMIHRTYAHHLRRVGG